VDAQGRQALQISLVRLSQGDRAAFEPVFTALWPLLSVLCARLLRDAALGEDAAQSALYKIFARASELDPERDAVAWAIGIAVWECKTLRKQAARRREDTTRAREAAPTAAEGSPEESAERRELVAALQSLWGELRPADTEVLDAVLRGEAPAIPSATFRKRVQRAMERLREVWRARHGT